MISELKHLHFIANTEDFVWREWGGLYAVFSLKDEATHFIDPLASLVFETLKNSDKPLSFDNLVSSVLSESGEDVTAQIIAAQLEDCLMQLERIGLVKAAPLREE